MLFGALLSRVGREANGPLVVMFGSAVVVCHHYHDANTKTDMIWGGSITGFSKCGYLRLVMISHLVY